MAMSNDTDGTSAAPAGDVIVSETSYIDTKASEPVADEHKADGLKIEASNAEEAAAPIVLVKEELPIVESRRLAAEAPKFNEAPKLAEAPKLSESPKIADLKVTAKEHKARPSLTP